VQLAKNKKIIAFLFIAILLTVALTGCGFGSSDQPICNKDGSILKYSIDDITSKELWGYYIRNEDGSFSPLNSGASGSTEDSTATDSGNTSSSERFFWWSDHKENDTYIDYEKITPELKNGTSLVAVFGSDSDDKLSSFSMERFAKLGYTIGTHVSLSDNGRTAYLDTQNTCPNSSMATIMSSLDSTDPLELKAINDDPRNVKTENVDTDINAFLGLEKNKRYKITVYIGTKVSSVVTKADTEVFKSQEAMDIKSPYRKTAKGYFIVNLPENIKPGYYSVPGYGIFKVPER